MTIIKKYVEASIIVQQENEAKSAVDEKLGELQEVKFLAVQVIRHKTKKQGGNIVYRHPSSHTPLKETEYYVTPEKLDVSVWDEALDGGYYQVLTAKFSKGHWVWVDVKPLTLEEVLKLPPIRLKK